MSSNKKAKVKRPTKEEDDDEKAGTSKDDAEGGKEEEDDDKKIQASLEQVFFSRGAKKAKLLEEEMANKAHPFWDHQPVPAARDLAVIEENTFMEPNKSNQEVQQEPYPLPANFSWHECNVDDDKEMNDIYTLLYENYVEDDDNMFRFDYSIPFIRWALKPPGFLRTWHLGVRATTNNKLLGFISAVPSQIHIFDKVVPMVEINFLCVHKKLRSKRLAPVLISEITRRVNLRGIFQAVYTAGVVISKPVGKCRYWHRSLNPKKLIEVKFSHLGPRMTMARAIRLYRLGDELKTPGFRKMELKDCHEAFLLLKNHLEQFKFAFVYTEEEFVHWFLTREGVVYSFVVEDPQTKKITDFTSFYSLPSTIINNPKHKTLNAAYSYYTATSKTNLKVLISDLLVCARRLGYDVFNCLDVMHNSEFLKDLKFGIGDGNLQYYIYNWKCPAVKPEEVGIVLL